MFGLKFNFNQYCHNITLASQVCPPTNVLFPLCVAGLNMDVTYKQWDNNYSNSLIYTAWLKECSFCFASKYTKFFPRSKLYLNQPRPYRRFFHQGNDKFLETTAIYYPYKLFLAVCYSQAVPFTNCLIIKLIGLTQTIGV